MVFSLAKKLVISATIMRQSSSPISAPRGSNALPTVAKMLVSTLSPGRFDSSHTTADDDQNERACLLDE